jgi:glycogen synthase
MLVWIIQISIISIVFIFVVHYLISFFKNTLTVPKIKDLVNSPSQKYQDIFNTISHSNQNSNQYTSIDLLPTADSGSMKDELKSFLKKQLNADDDGPFPTFL